MDKNLIDKWNKSTSKIPFDRDPSNYAIEKEKEFGEKSQILDLGGGQGDDALYFARKGHEVIIFDISEEGLNRAKTKFRDAGLEKELVTKQVDLSKRRIPLEEGKVDIVYARLSLHYFPRNITIQLFREVLRVLRKNGKAFITLKSPKDKKEMNFLKKTAREIEPGIFKETNGQIKTRLSDGQLIDILSEARVSKYFCRIGDYTEKLSGRRDRVKSGKTKFVLTEIIVQKTKSLVETSVPAKQTP